MSQDIFDRGQKAVLQSLKNYIDSKPTVTKQMILDRIKLLLASLPTFVFLMMMTGCGDPALGTYKGTVSKTGTCTKYVPISWGFVTTQAELTTSRPQIDGLPFSISVKASGKGYRIENTRDACAPWTSEGNELSSDSGFTGDGDEAGKSLACDGVFQSGTIEFSSAINEIDQDNMVVKIVSERFVSNVEGTCTTTVSGRLNRESYANDYF